MIVLHPRVGPVASNGEKVEQWPSGDCKKALAAVSRMGGIHRARLQGSTNEEIREVLRLELISEEESADWAEAKDRGLITE